MVIGRQLASGLIALPIDSESDTGTRDSVYAAVVVTDSLPVSRGSSNECRTAPRG